MIAEILLENFKGFQKLRIRTPRITAFVGPNGTGKSSVLQAFGLLKQSLADIPIAPEEGFFGDTWDVDVNGPLVNLKDIADFQAANSKPSDPLLLGFSGIGKKSPGRILGVMHTFSRSCKTA